MPSAAAHILLLYCGCLVVLSTAAENEELVGVEEPGSLIVETEYGMLRGMDNGDARVFKGVRYGGDVSAPNRWRDAPPPDSWPGIKNATVDPPACPQNCSPIVPCPEVQSEDCLFLNVFTPRDANSHSQLSVLVYIHGGGFNMGYSAVPMFDGSYLANHSNIVVVTINYRFGALGFLAYGRGNDAITGNYGIKDQRLALEWVQDNIAAFGGNPDDVTLSGESAGAMSVAIHMTSPLSYGLFHKAIVQSNPFGIEYKQRASRTDFVNELCEDNTQSYTETLQCLREEVTVEEILYAQGLRYSSEDDESIWASLLSWTPVIDGVELFDQPLALFEAGNFTEVPTIMGTTKDEGIVFVYGLPPLNEQLYNILVGLMFGADNADAALELYPPIPGAEDQRLRVSRIVNDYAFYCTTIWAAESVIEGSNAPVYSYLFNYPFLFKDVYEQCKYLSCHGSELNFVFHTQQYQMTLRERQLSDKASAYWGNFVKSSDGNPNTESTLDDWTEFTTTNWETLVLDTTYNLEIRNEHRKDYCDVLRGFEFNTDALRRLVSGDLHARHPSQKP